MISCLTPTFVQLIVLWNTGNAYGKLTSSARNVTADVGGSANFTCTSNSSHHIRWSFRSSATVGVTVVYSGNVPRSNLRVSKRASLDVNPANRTSTLILRGIEAEDNGTYLCAESTGDKDVVNFELDVYDPGPKVVPLPSALPHLAVAISLVVVVNGFIIIALCCKTKGSLHRPDQAKHVDELELKTFDLHQIVVPHHHHHQHQEPTGCSDDTAVDVQTTDANVVCGRQECT